jgi:prepilin-type N-terminal cleavage/methylation domain-containing protein
MRLRHPRPRAFTIIELLVVVSIIGLLVALIMPSLAGVRRQSRKTSELNSIKQVGLGWLMYGNNNADAVLPGFLEAQVQLPPVPGVSRGWDVKYKFPNRTDIPIDPVDPIAGPWTWRLMPYLDFNHDMVHGYTGEDGWDMTSIETDLNEAREVAYQPAFGYNGFYLGGYWTMTPDFNGTVDVPRPMFWNHCRAGSREALDIPQGISQIRRSTDMIVFCSSSRLPTGVHQRFRDDTPGSHLVAPPTLADVEQWGRVRNTGSGGGDIGAVEVFASPDAYTPISRYTNTAAYFCADGHVDQSSVDSLIDQRRWINAASSKDYSHTVCPP